MITSFLVSETESDLCALKYGQQSISRGAVSARSKNIANNIRKSISPGTSVLLPFDNPIDFLCGLIGIFEGGGTVVPCRNDAITQGAYVRDLVSPSARLNSDDSLDLFSENPEIHKGTLILLTTGSTGSPKGVVLELADVVANSFMSGNRLKINNLDSWCVEVDFSFTSGICHLLMAWTHKVPLIFTSGWDADKWSDHFNNEKSGFGGSPIQLSRICDLVAGKHPLKLMSSGDFLPVSYINKIRNKFPNTEIHKYYGLTELSGRFCSQPEDLIDDEPLPAGFPLPVYEVEIRDNDGKAVQAGVQGNVWVRSSWLYKGYIRIETGFQDRSSSEESWFDTNDKAIMSDSGNITLLGREHDVFKVGGEKVSRIQIEATLSKILKEEFVVLPVEHPSFGYMPVLFLTRYEGMPSWDEIRQYGFDNLEPKFVPMIAYILDSLPRTSTGKVIRSELLNSVDRLERF